MSMHNAPSQAIATPQSAPVRKRLLVKGVVQGVGFRPTVYRMATELGIAGWVRNTTGGVEIEIEGDPQTIVAFEHRLQHNPPPHWAIQSIAIDHLTPNNQHAFFIRESTQAGGCLRLSIPPDLATCDSCLREIFDPGDRRFGYPFTNCTACGPRYSIITGLPYDRARTTMDGFTMCPACQAEYGDPGSRRYHAQPNACPACGPQLALMTTSGQVLSQQNAALQAACDAIRAGKIVAVKGLGGFHLFADARQPETVAALRQRKHRPEKPFALMAPSLQAVEAMCHLSHTERQALCSSRAPIVLLRRRTGDIGLAGDVAPRNPYLGVMLPATPLHHLMLDALRFPVIATSGNLSEEPICTDARQAIQRLGTIADLMLTHDRPIARPIDDSVVQEIDGEIRVIRLARGYAPQSITLPVKQVTGPLLAVGAHQKTAIGFAMDAAATLSQHIGDLESHDTIAAHRAAADDIQHLLQAAPVSVAADPHPDYQSTRDTQQIGLPIVSVQHHAAHVYSAMAEHGIDAQATIFGVAWDGTGLGDDGTAWGGELLKICGTTVERVAHLEPFKLPGGDAAARQPWRSAVGLLHAVYGSELWTRQDLPVIDAVSEADRRVLQQMLKKNVGSPTTTSVGRLFDGVAALLGLQRECSFEGQAAMSLQFAAESADSDVTPLRIEITRSQPVRLDWRPAIKDILERIGHGEPIASIARAFHVALAQSLAQLIEMVASSANRTVVLAGGCFQNKLLTELTASAFRRRGITPLPHRQVPTNDGGIALGQLYAGVLHQSTHTEGSC